MMLYKLIPPSTVTAAIQLPASKSISNRALIINALGKGTYAPENLSDCDDTQVMIKALTEGKEMIDIMAAGTAMRLSLIHIYHECSMNEPPFLTDLSQFPITCPS